MDSQINTDQKKKGFEMENKIVKKMIKNPYTGKRMREVFVAGVVCYRWNSAYRVYNSVVNFEQLRQNDVAKIDWRKS